MSLAIPTISLVLLLSSLYRALSIEWFLIRTIVNDQRAARVADLISDFRNLQYYIAAAPVESPDQHDYYTEGWRALRQCSIDGQHILNCAADTRVPSVRGGPEEQDKAELQQYVVKVDIVLDPTLNTKQGLARCLLSPPRSSENLSPSSRSTAMGRMARPRLARPTAPGRAC